MHEPGNTEEAAAPRYRPVVAIEVEGLLERPVLPSRVPWDVMDVEITMRRNVYPTATRVEPEWDYEEESRAHHWFSRLGVDWVKGLLDEGTEVVWASTWREYANVYFADVLGLPRLPVGVRLDGGRHESVPAWKASQLAGRFDGRPLLWVTDELPAEGGRVLGARRSPRDRFLTGVHLIPFNSWVSDGDIQRMSRWLDLVQTPEGHEELRRLRRRDQERARKRRRAREQPVDEEDDPDSELLYRQWHTLRERLEEVAAPGSGLPGPLATYVIEWDGAIRLEEVKAVRDQFGLDGDPSAEELWPLLELGGD